MLRADWLCGIAASIDIHAGRSGERPHRTPCLPHHHAGVRLLESGLFRPRYAAEGGEQVDVRRLVRAALLAEGVAWIIVLQTLQPWMGPGEQ